MSTASHARSTFVALLLCAGALAACGTASPTGSPAGSGGPSADPTGGPRPLTTPWPGNTAQAIEALGVSDGEIRQAINDFSAGVANEDLALMRRAANGLAGIDVLVPNADDLTLYPATQALGAGLQEVLPRIAGSASQLRDAIDAGDARTIGSASRELATALAGYAQLQAELAGWVVQVPEQKRVLLR